MPARDDERPLADPSLVTVPASIDEVSDEPDQRTRDWEGHQARTRGSLENQLLELDLRLRKRYAFWLFLVLVGWLVAVLGVLLAAGLDLLNLSDKVLIATLATSTANVIGLYVVVARYIFPPRS